MLSIQREELEIDPLLLTVPLSLTHTHTHTHTHRINALNYQLHSGIQDLDNTRVVTLHMRTISDSYCTFFLHNFY